jgi:hypothetical protein
MTVSEEWGPWIEHDGRGCPVPAGTLVTLEYVEDAIFVTSAGPTGERGRFRIMRAEGRPGSWTYGNPHSKETWSPADSGSGRLATPIIRYRIRKPRALIQLIDMVENLTAPTERVDA